MSRGEEKAKRRWWRPRFSVRTLAIVMTLLCITIAGWRGTRNASDSSVNIMWRLDDDSTVYVAESTAPFPFLISRDECEENDFAGKKTTTHHRRYYLWLFGPKIKLPFESRVSQTVIRTGLRDNHDLPFDFGAWKATKRYGVPHNLPMRISTA